MSLDLDAVTLLSSQAVRALFATRTLFEGTPHTLTLHAKPGSPAATVLALVGLADPPHPSTPRSR